MKKDILVSIRFSSSDKETVKKVKAIDPTFNLSRFIRESLAKKHRELKRKAKKSLQEEPEVVEEKIEEQSNEETENAEKVQETPQEVPKQPEKAQENPTQAPVGNDSDIENLF